MKQETLKKLQELVQSQRLEFTDVAEGVAVNHDLTDAELKELVEIEYGTTSQDIVKLFTVICKKLLKEAHQ